MNEYQKHILSILTQRDYSTVQQLSEMLEVSPSTIRRQLSFMEKRGAIFRTHGGARISTPISYEVPYENRAAQSIEAKRLIATVALSLINPDIVIGLSGGTTCTELARQIRTLEKVTVVTNAVNIALEVQTQLGRRVMVTGGMLNQNSYELVGSQVSQTLQNVHIDICFLGASGIKVDFGFSMSDEPEAVAGRALIAASDQVVVIADHTKIGKSTFARLCPFREVDILITDDQIASDQLDLLITSGLKVMLAHSNDSAAYQGNMNGGSRREGSQ